MALHEHDAPAPAESGSTTTCLREDTTTCVSVGCACALCYAVALRMTRCHNAAEDVTDLVHSLVATRCACGALAAMRCSHGGRTCLNPAADARARRFVLASTTYFAADLLLVCARLTRGDRPRLWAGRLAHHVIQLVANLPALVCPPPIAREIRTYLMPAYAAEASNIFLRVRNLIHASGQPARLARRIVMRALLLTFALTRLVNFPICTYFIWSRRAVLPPRVLRLHLAFAGCAPIDESGSGSGSGSESGSEALMSTIGADPHVDRI